MNGPAHRKLLAAWGAVAAGLLAMAGLLVGQSHRFGYDYRVIDMPVLAFAAAAILAGAIFLALVWLVRESVARRTGGRLLIGFVVVVGVILRLMMFATEPVLEDDYQRYLWDGAVTANGLNPYAVVPADAQSSRQAPEIVALATKAGPVLRRVNHPDLRTIYPPVAQLAFATAHEIAPFQLQAWRAVCLLFDVATLGLIFLLLGEVGRSLLWATLYWWNPLVLKELFNSAHTEAVLMPLVLCAVYLAVRHRQLASTVVLALAVGVKIWPALLLPLVIRPLLAKPWRLALALILFLLLMVLWTLPVVLAGFDQTSGFVAYAERWKTNSALFPALEGLAEAVLPAVGLDDLAPGRLVRGMIAVGLAGLALAVAVKPMDGARDIVCRAAVIVGALVLFSPAQFPWYSIWFLVLLPFYPLLGFVVLAVTLPLYYTAFHLMARDQLDLYKDGIVWMIWLPVWGLLLMELVWPNLRQWARRAPDTI